LEYEQASSEEDSREDEKPSTPRKRKKQSQVSTPRKKRPASAVSTPVKRSGGRVKKDIQVTPLPLRTLSPSLMDSPYKIAQANLHVSAVPSSLPCREEEYNTILDQLEQLIDEGTGGCIYVSGVPGTGKTATVRQVVRALNERVEAGVSLTLSDGRN
jgi:origin recognition complex subunit 1